MALHLVIGNGRNVGLSRVLEGSRIVVGRAPDCAFILDEDGVSRRHIVFAREGDVWTATCSPGASTMVVNGVATDRHIVAEGDTIQIGESVTLKVVETEELARSRGPCECSHAERRDGLTGLLAKPAFADRIKAAFQETVDRRAGVLSLVVFDLDFFMKLNDSYGHRAGDFVLRSVAEIMKRAVTPHEGLARYGGEEFGIALPGVDADDAIALAERVRHGVAEWPFAHEGRRIPATISAGVATLRVEGIERTYETPKTFVHAADEALFHAKRYGRNRVRHVERLTPGT